MSLCDGNSDIAGFKHERDDAERLMRMRVDVIPRKGNPYRKREDHNQRERSSDAAKLSQDERGFRFWLFGIAQAAILRNVIYTAVGAS